jgi:predicted Fe-Mo cluster-binding NifX family protein
MRIAVASDDGVRVALHTGRSQGFAVFEVTGNTATPVEQRPNTLTAHARRECDGGHTHPAGSSHHSHAPLIEALNDCRVLVTRGMGPRLVADLAACGIDAYVCDVDAVAEAARLYALGQLPRIVTGTCGCHH